MKTIGIFIFLSLYIALCTTHLVFCYQKKEKPRILTKPLLLLTLGICMCFYVTDYPLIFIACFLACIGDILLIFDRRKLFFLIGAMFFASSHVVNIITQIQIIGLELSWWHYLLIYLPTPIAGLVGYFFIEKKPFSLFKYAFSLLHLTNVIFSIISLCTGHIASGMMVLFGYLCCIASDIILDKMVSKIEKLDHNFYIMLLYLVGQLLTYFGLAFGVLGVF